VLGSPQFLDHLDILVSGRRKEHLYELMIQVLGVTLVVVGLPVWRLGFA